MTLLPDGDNQRSLCRIELVRLDQQNAGTLFARAKKSVDTGPVEQRFRGAERAQSFAVAELLNDEIDPLGLVNQAPQTALNVWQHDHIEQHRGRVLETCGLQSTRLFLYRAAII